MRVAHVLRADHVSHVGGDLVQLRATVDALRQQGIDAIAAPVDEIEGPVDVVHLYNLQRSSALRADLGRARSRFPHARIVISPVLWPPDPRLLVGGPDRWTRARVAKAWARLAQRWRSCRRALAAVDAVLPNSETELERISRLYHLSVERWHVVPNGVALERWSGSRRTASFEEITQWGLAEPADTFVTCVARIEPYKNQLTLVRALHQLPGVALVLVGPTAEPRYGAAVRAEAARLPGRVALIGTRSADEVQQVLAASAVHVLPSLRETPGLATLEAAASGCEVVATRHGSAPEYLGDDAAYADPTSPSSIAAAIREVLARPRQPALRRRVERYDWTQAARTLVGVYRDVVAAPTSTASR